jgi:hypothetical protein
MKPLVRGFLFFVVALGSAFAAEPRARNVVLITIDGLRWQEIFRGAEDALFTKEAGGVPDNSRDMVRRDFWADTPDERRKKLAPFLWSTIATRGQIYGNRDVGGAVSVANPQSVSYPGYNEILTGAPSSVIVSNSPIPNPHVTVLEFLHEKPAFAGRVAACAAWDVFQAILHPARSKFPVWTTRTPASRDQASPRILEVEKWMADIPPITPSEHFDAFVNVVTRDVFARQRPRVFLYALGEPDEWAHARRYDRYLYSIQRCDRFIRELWEWLQAQPEYRDNTTILLTPDHGRGVLGEDWTSHGIKVPRSNETWFAALGPDTPARGEVREGPELHQAQIAATVAALVGEDFRARFPQAAAPIDAVLPARAR